MSLTMGGTIPASPFKIEYGIEKPSRKWNGKTPFYPFRDMKVGGTFAVPVTSRDDLATVQQRICSAAWAFRHRKKKLDWVFSTAQLSDEYGDSLVRCWRDK